MNGERIITLGERRVRTDFNVSGSSQVDELKRLSAELINKIHDLKGDGAAVIDGEKARLISLALTDIESGAMWAVKAATF